MVQCSVEIVERLDREIYPCGRSNTVAVNDSFKDRAATGLNAMANHTLTVLTSPHRSDGEGRSESRNVEVANRQRCYQIDMEASL